MEIKKTAYEESKFTTIRVAKETKETFKHMSFIVEDINQRDYMQKLVDMDIGKHFKGYEYKYFTKAKSPMIQVYKTTRNQLNKQAKERGLKVNHYVQYLLENYK